MSQEQINTVLDQINQRENEITSLKNRLRHLESVGPTDQHIPESPISLHRYGRLVSDLRPGDKFRFSGEGEEIYMITKFPDGDRINAEEMSMVVSLIDGNTHIVDPYVGVILVW